MPENSRPAPFSPPFSPAQPQKICGDLFDILILGAGASGLMCALEASRLEKTPLSIAAADAAPVLGRKMRLAGGGMGNFTNRQLGPEWYVGENPEFVRSGLRAFPCRAALDMLESFNLRWEEREYGQIFGLQPAAKLAEAMAERCRAQGVVFFLRHAVRCASHNGSLFCAEFSAPDGIRRLYAKKLVLALGSPAFGSSGATDAGLALAKSFGHSCLPFRPVLAPLLLPENHPLRDLQGISVPAGLTAGKKHLIRPLLFTHKGWSGPAGLLTSCFWRQQQRVFIDFLPNSPGIDNACGKFTASAMLRRSLPPRLADALANAALQAMQNENIAVPPPWRPLAEWNRRQRGILSRTIHEHDMTPTRTEGMNSAEAAAGGVATDGIAPRTMESLLKPGLFILGELQDITGLLGGYNLHWAFACGKAAGRALRTACLTA